MTQANVRTFAEVAFLAKETTFGILPTMKPLIIESDSFEDEQTHTALEDMDSSPLGLDTKDVIDGVFEGSGKFVAKLKPHATQITASAPLVQPALFDFLECVLGGMHVGDGSAITDGTTSSVTVSSDTGFQVGQVFGIAGNNDVQVAVVTDKPGGGVLTFWPSLSAPVTSGTAVNGYNAFFTGTNTKSFSLQHARVDHPNAQREHRGCMGKAKIVTNLNEVVRVEAEFTSASGRDGALGISTAVQTNPLAAGGHAIKNAIVYLQPETTTTRNHYCVESFSMEMDPALEFVPCHGAPNGKNGVMRVKGRGLVKIMLEVRFDPSKDTEFENRDGVRLLYSVPKGAGLAKRHVGVYAPKVKLARKPKQKKQGGRLLYELEYVAQIDTTAAEDTVKGAPVVVFAL
jgi:hypothetical protein